MHNEKGPFSCVLITLLGLFCDIFALALEVILENAKQLNIRNYVVSINVPTAHLTFQDCRIFFQIFLFLGKFGYPRVVKSGIE